MSIANHLARVAGTVALATLLGAAMPAHADPKADILAAHAAMVAQGKFRVQNVGTSGKDTTESSNEVQWPDRFHMKNAEMEMIILPGETWMNQGGQWSKLPMNMGALVKQLTPDAMKQGYDNMTNARQLPDAEVDGHAAHVYEYDTRATVMGIEAQSHIKLYVDAATGLIAKQEVDGTAMGVSSHTVSTYTYDSSIDIKAPN